MVTREQIQAARKEFLAGDPEARILCALQIKKICQIMISPDSFTDELSKREFVISGLCQKCQDEMFKEPK